jgi:hypothetical protein
MEQTLQSQYNLIKEGKGNKAYFLKSAYRLFPDMLSPVNTFEDTIKILKNRSILSEGVGGVVTSGKKQDWHAIFNENMDKIKDEKDEEEDGEYKDWMNRHEEEEDAKHTLPNYRKLKEDDNEDKLNQAVKYYLANPNYLELKDVATKFGVNINDLQKHLSSAQEKAKSGDSTQATLQGIGLFEGKEEPSKEVLDLQKHSYDYKDEKNYDNVFGQEFLKGYYTELKDPKNADKHVEELREIVAKNLAKDINYYVKDGQFGIKGVGYTTEAPGLGEPKEPKGKFASSGYGDIPKSSNLQESVLRSQIHLLIKEVLAENTKFKKDEEVRFLDDVWTVVGTGVDDEGEEFVHIKLGKKEHKNTPISAVEKIINELQQEPASHADEEEFETKIIDKLKSELRTKNKHHQTKYGEPDMDLVHYYADAIKFVGQNTKDIAEKFLNHSKPEGGIDDAIKFALSNADSNPIHEAKKK